MTDREILAEENAKLRAALLELLERTDGYNDLGYPDMDYSSDELIEIRRRVRAILGLTNEHLRYEVKR